MSPVTVVLMGTGVGARAEGLHGGPLPAGHRIRVGAVDEVGVRRNPVGIDVGLERRGSGRHAVGWRVVEVGKTKAGVVKLLMAA